MATQLPTMPERARAVVLSVCDLHGLTEEAVRGPRRIKSYVKARRQAWILLRDLRMADGRPPSYPQIGVWFGRDHSTIVQGVQAFGEESIA